MRVLISSLISDGFKVVLDMVVILKFCFLKSPATDGRLLLFREKDFA